MEHDGNFNKYLGNDERSQTSALSFTLKQGLADVLQRLH